MTCWSFACCLALAQEAKVLILDEPTNHLDPRFQFEIMELVKSLGLTTLIALHDLNLAAYYCSKIYLLNKGKVFKQGSPKYVLTRKNIKEVYGVDVSVNVNSKTKRLNLVFVR